ncbi:MAG: hypothetical protein SVX43_16835 [Cyanobacteriota bacterium]|nr:hypothetical protein [Cyanobacteriota bacterium]
MTSMFVSSPINSKPLPMLYGVWRVGADFKHELRAIKTDIKLQKEVHPT